jgi:hypothetical protein
VRNVPNLSYIRARNDNNVNVISSGNTDSPNSGSGNSNNNSGNQPLQVCCLLKFLPIH